MDFFKYAAHPQRKDTGAVWIQDLCYNIVIQPPSVTTLQLLMTKIKQHFDIT